jgi:hypothetical protein
VDEWADGVQASCCGVNLGFARFEFGVGLVFLLGVEADGCPSC